MTETKTLNDLGSNAGLERHLDAMQQLLDEAADVIDRLPIDVRDALEVRHWLATELYGAAAMVRAAMRTCSNAKCRRRCATWRQRLKRRPTLKLSGCRFWHSALMQG